MRPKLSDLRAWISIASRGMAEIVGIAYRLVPIAVVLPGQRGRGARSMSWTSARPTAVAVAVRSAEHTSRLQSLVRVPSAVSCLTQKTQRYRYTRFTYY